MNHCYQVLDAARQCLFAAVLFLLVTALPGQYLTEALFDTANSPPAPSASTLVATAADFNQNGCADLVYINGLALGLLVDLDPVVAGIGPYSMQAYGIGWLLAADALEAVAADVNADGQMDLACNRFGALSIHLGIGDGTFIPPTTGYGITGVYGMWRYMSALDANNDGLTDLLLVTGSQNPTLTGVYCLLNQYPNWVGIQVANTTQFTGPGSSGPFSGDFDGDGNVDIAFQDAWYPSGAQQTRIFWGNGTGLFAWNNITPPGFPTTANTMIRAVADMNADGIADLVCTSPATMAGGITEQIQTLLGSTSRTLIAAGTFPIPPNNVSPATTFAADFNRDGWGDVVRVSAFVPSNPPAVCNMTVTMALGRPGGLFHQAVMSTPHTPFSTLGCPYSVIADFDGDSDLDLMCTPRASPLFYFSNSAIRGAGCPGSGGAPPNLWTSDAMVGNAAFTASLWGALGNAHAVMAIATGLSGNALSNCGIYLGLSGPVSFFSGVTDSWGNLTWPLPIPNNPLLHGVPFFAQAAVLDPLGPNLGGLNLALTPARTIIVW